MSDNVVFAPVGAGGRLRHLRRFPAGFAQSQTFGSARCLA